MHLTNYSINKRQSEDVKWRLTDLWDKIIQMFSKQDLEVLKRRIDDIVVKTIISAEETMTHYSETVAPNSNSCFQLLGFDILIDSYLKPWLLEVN